jgi:hypothetical protein
MPERRLYPPVRDQGFGFWYQTPTHIKKLPFPTYPLHFLDFHSIHCILVVPLILYVLFIIFDGIFTVVESYLGVSYGTVQQLCNGEAGTWFI